jgi:hypothetical protein
MQSGTLLSCGVLVAALAVPIPGTDAAASPPAAIVLPQQPGGHLVLIVQGDARELRVTGAVAKTAPCGAQPKGLNSDWELRVLSPSGSVLHSQPLDLAAFDMDPAHAGLPDRASGCVVRSTHVAMLVSVPAFAQATIIEFAYKGTRKGTCTVAELERLLHPLSRESSR